METKVPVSPYDFNKSSVYQTSRLRSLATNSQINKNKTLTKPKRSEKDKSALGTDDHLSQFVNPIEEQEMSIHQVSI